MPEALVSELLVAGELPRSAPGIVFQPTCRTRVDRILLTNTSTTTHATVNLYIWTPRSFGASGRRQITPRNTMIQVGCMAVLDEPMVMMAGDRVDGDATGPVDCVIFGVKE